MSPTFDPFLPCEGHANCRTVDMNMACGPKGVCECRRDMRWNGDVGECQLYMVKEKECRF